MLKYVKKIPRKLFQRQKAREILVALSDYQFDGVAKKSENIHFEFDQFEYLVMKNLRAEQLRARASSNNTHTPTAAQRDD